MKLSPYVREFIEPVRTLFFNLKFRKINTHNRTYAGNRFVLSKVHIGKETYGKINVYSYNDRDAGELIIGNYCSIAKTAMFLTSGNHNYKRFSTFPFQKALYNENCSGSKGNIQIDDDVWIGEMAIVLSGTHIGQGAIVAAGAVCSGLIPPYSIVGGGTSKGY